MINRVILIVLDSVGVGALPDAADFGDAGTNTVGHIARETAGFALPNLQQLGLGNLPGLDALPAVDAPTGAFARAAEQSPGKDTTTGHWEISGLILDQPFPAFPDGFPANMMRAFEKKIGRPVLGNYAASGTVVIEELGVQHMATGFPIVYTSADSVFQIAMHEQVIPIERQYEICQIARDMLRDELAVGRVIARPFVGEGRGAFTRTSNRRDFSLKPPGKTVLRLCMEAGQTVKAVGKMWDIFAEDGMTHHIKTKDNMEGVDRTLAYMRESDPGIVLTNLVDFDMHYGHRRDVPGYANCLVEFDRRLPELLAALRDDDLLLITADHGNDPTHTGTDHTREYVPILAAGAPVKPGAFGTRESFADIGATIADLLRLPATRDGRSFAAEIMQEGAA